MTGGVARKVAEYCRNHALLHQNDHLVVGVSGGPDSLCLLHLLHTLAPGMALTLTVAHLNHQLRGRAADADEDFVRAVASAWQIPIRVETANILAMAAAQKQSIEEAARQARYAFLWRVAAQVGAAKIAVAHNADDQAETVLMHFLRGAGLSGLRGMLPAINISRLRLNPNNIPPETSGPAPQLIRPLLEISRAEIEAYCREHNLTPRRDASNQDTTFFRNRLRHELIPLLETYNPNIRQVLCRTAGVAAADAELLRQHLEAIWPAIIKSQTPNRVEFDLPAWRNLPLAMKRSTLRRAVQHLRRSLRDISFEHIETAVALAEKGKTGAEATLPRGLKLAVGYTSLVIAPEHVTPFPARPDAPYLNPGQVVTLAVPGVTPLPHTGWQVHAALLLPNKVDRRVFNRLNPWEAYLDAGRVGDAPVLRTRRPGDVFCPLGMGGRRKKINEFMIDQKIPADRRGHIPLLVTGKRVMWVCGYRPDERAAIHAATRRVLHLKFEPV